MARRLGGAYAYGKTAVAAGYNAAGVSVKIRRKVRSDWLALMPNAHEGYVSWEKSETIRRRGQRNSTSADVIAAVRQLVLIANDDPIAGIRNRNGLVTGYGNRWTRERATSLRSHHGIAVYKPADDGIEPWLNLSKAARLLHVAPRTLRLAAEAGEIEAIHPLPDGPWLFSRAVLSASPARAITERARQNPKYPAGSHPDQQNLFSSITQTDGCSDARLYSRIRPHSSLGYRTPSAYADHLTAPGHRAALNEGAARWPVAHTAPKGVSTDEALIAAG